MPALVLSHAKPFIDRVARDSQLRGQVFPRPILKHQKFPDFFQFHGISWVWGTSNSIGHDTLTKIFVKIGLTDCHGKRIFPLCFWKLGWNRGP